MYGRVSFVANKVHENGTTGGFSSLRLTPPRNERVTSRRSPAIDCKDPSRSDRITFEFTGVHKIETAKPSGATE